MTNERMQSLIKKYRMELALRDGAEVIKVTGKIPAAEVDEIKTNKPAILAELHRINDDRKTTELIAAAARKEENRANAVLSRFYSFN